MSSEDGQHGRLLRLVGTLLLVKAKVALLVPLQSLRVQPMLKEPLASTFPSRSRSALVFVLIPASIGALNPRCTGTGPMKKSKVAMVGLAICFSKLHGF